MRMKVFSLHLQGDSEVNTSGTTPQKILEQGTPAAGQKHSTASACITSLIVNRHLLPAYLGYSFINATDS